MLFSTTIVWPLENFATCLALSSTHLRSLALPAPKPFFLVGVFIGISATLFGILLGVIFSIYVENIRQFLSTIFNISLFPEEIYFLSTMPSEINPFSIWEVPSPNKINNEIEEIPWSKGNRVLAVLASFIAELR